MAANLSSEILLTTGDYNVLKRVPVYWFEEPTVRAEIASRTAESDAGVARRLARLIRLRLIERRDCATVDGYTEVRRVG